MESEKYEKFSVEARKVWDELKFDERLKNLFEREESKPMRSRNPFDPKQNPFFIIEDDFVRELVSRKIIEDLRRNYNMITIFLKERFLQSNSLKSKDQFKKSETEDCDGNCKTCPKAKEIVEKMEKEFYNFDGKWN